MSEMRRERLKDVVAIVGAKAVQILVRNFMRQPVELSGAQKGRDGGQGQSPLSVIEAGEPFGDCIKAVFE